MIASLHLNELYHLPGRRLKLYVADFKYSWQFFHYSLCYSLPTRQTSASYVIILQCANVIVLQEIIVPLSRRKSYFYKYYLYGLIVSRSNM